jgi:hypothetical protein
LIIPTFAAPEKGKGEMLEWLKRHAWKVCISVKGYPGFESLSLRLRPPKLDRAKEGSSSVGSLLIERTTI